MVTYDVAVLGAGIGGASVAFFAARAGLRVIVVDSGPAGGGCTGQAAANIRCHHTDPRVAKLAIEGREIYRHWGDIVGGHCGFVETGGLYIVPPEDAAKLRHNNDMLRGLELNTLALNPAELRVLQPMMVTDDVGAAAYEPESGYVDPMLAVSGLLEAARAKGAEILLNRNSPRLLAEHGRVTGIEAGNERMLADTTVLTAGMGSRAAAREIGLDLPLYPFPLGAGSLRRPPGMAGPMAVIDRCIGGWYRADREDMVVECGFEDLDFSHPGNHEHYAAGVVPPSREGFIAALSRLSRRIPGVIEGMPGRTWSGLDSCTPDGHALVGPSGVEGLWLMTGANGVGIRMSPPYARAMVGALVDGDFAGSDVGMLGLERFASGALLGRDEGAYGVGSFS